MSWRDWEVAGDGRPGGVEYGAPVSGGIVAVGGRLPQTESKSDEREFVDGEHLDGIVCSWGTLHTMKGQFEVMDRNCFARSLTSGKAIRLLIDHDETKLLGTTADSLELSSDAEALRFSYRLHDTKWSRKAAGLVADRTLREMSVGYRVVIDEHREIEGEDVRFIKDAELLEISIVTKGAVKGTSVRLVSPGEHRILQSYDRLLERFDEYNLKMASLRHHAS